MQTFHIEQPGPLLDALARVINNRTRAKKWLRLGRITVNGEAAGRHDQPLAAGDVVRIESNVVPTIPGRIPGLEIVFEDESILVVDKPAGLLTIATDTERTKTAYFKVTEYLKSRQRGEPARAFIVHRLDRETSGLLLFAKTADAKQRLQDTWDDVEKRYFAIVEGAPAEPTGTVESDLTETAALSVFSGRKTKRSKHAVTHYTVQKDCGPHSLIEVRTETGRKHQIRVHLADLGHAIIGDDRYGKRRTSGRLGLHACFLRFRHPVSGEFIEFRSELPVELARTLASSKSKLR
ncbi:MAG: RluA family pseudouridine synthase [Planctomycetaceae bacterium]